MNIEELYDHVQQELKKEQRRRSILGQIYKLSKEADSESKIKRIEELKERMNSNA